MPETANSYRIGKDWINLNTETGLPVGTEFILQNTGIAGDIVEIAISALQPIAGFRGVGIFQFNPFYRVSDKAIPVWVRFIRYDRNDLDVGQKTVLLSVQTNPEIQDTNSIPFDLYDSEVIDNRLIKVSASDGIISPAKKGLAYSLSAEFSVLDNTRLALNISPASDLTILSVFIDQDLVVEIYDEFSTGAAGSIINPVNINMISIDESPTQAQLFSLATNAGRVISTGKQSVKPYIIAGVGSEPGIVVHNTTGSTKDIRITVTYEETGERLPLFGLTASTLLQPITEMSDYG